MGKEEPKNGRKEKYKTLMNSERGKRLKGLIKKKGTQESFFDKYGEELGVSFGSLKNYMAGSDIPLDVLQKLIVILDTTADYLLFGNEDRTAKKEECKSKDKIPLTDVYRSIELLAEAFGEDTVLLDGNDVNIRIRNSTIHDGIYQVKRLTEIIKENADLKGTLEEAIEKILNADGYVVERKSLYGKDEIYVYNSKTDCLKYVAEYVAGERACKPARYEIRPIWESDGIDFDGDTPF